MTYANNPAFKEAFVSTVHNARFYVPSDTSTGFHVSRVVGAQAQDIYSGAGATKETIDLITKAMLDLLEDEGKARIRTEGALLMQNLRYRLQYPVDEDCLVRMGAILTFMESPDYGFEEHDSLLAHHTELKLRLAKGGEKKGPDSKLYAFFLSMGAAYTPSYNGLSDICLDLEYHQQRAETLQSMTPQHLFQPK
jgi:hypothetical protein